jgi:heme-degrading monooxygenase HmoA
MWRGYASPDQAGAYPEHFRNQVLGDLRQVDGFLGADLVQRETGGMIELSVLTRWTSMDAVAAFAGDDPSRAVVEPGAVAALDHYDETVIHHEVVVHEPPPD